MCGIVGYIGTKEAYPILIKGLHHLEYRGYDSAGIALISSNQELNVYKTKGKVADLERFAKSKDISGTVGIAHTRWATHGEPNDINAHPHYSQSKNLALIHNGIIENYTVLRAELVYLNDEEIAVIRPGDIVIAISQSGETADTLAAIELAKSKGAFIYGICNVVGSSIARATDSGSYIHVGPEIGVASTKAFTGQVTSKIFTYARNFIYLGIATTDSIYEKTISNIQEIKARKGKVIAIVSEGDQLVHDIADYCIEVPHVLESFVPLVASIPLQLLAYYIAVNKGRNVDQPRNLAKLVTVE